MTADRTIDYEALAQDAMRSVVRVVLTRVAKSGLPGDHHFYISFDTQHPGSSLSKRLKEKYPEEMTIVLQHRFWDLLVSEDRFEVKLTFDGIPERLVVPLTAIKVFFDPSVRYGLQFEDPEGSAVDRGTVPRSNDRGGASEAPSLVGDTATGPRALGVRKPRSPRKPGPVPARADRDGEVPSAPRPVPAPVPQPISANVVSHDGARPRPVPAATDTGRDPPAEPSKTEPQPGPGGAQIVSLSDFRKK